MRQFSRPHLYSQLQILGTQVWSFEVLYSSKAAALACPAAEGCPSLCHVLFFTRPLLPHIQNLMVAVANEAVSAETDWKGSTVERDWKAACPEA